MTDITFASEPTVKVTRIEGTDLDICRAAWVSTRGERAADEINEERVAGLINMMMRDRHGSVFEQVGLQFITSAPIFVWREHMRHRLANYNELSSRYTQLEAKFYIPAPGRAMVQEGKPGAYNFVTGSEEQYEYTETSIRAVCSHAYTAYEEMLKNGIAKEVARMVLPVNIYSTAYVRMNVRALMNFLSLRLKTDDTTVPTFPQYEISQVAQKYEDAFAEAFPITYGAFVRNGRVA